MGGPFTFIASLFSFGASGALTWKECKSKEEQFNEWNSHKYSLRVQGDYDNNFARLNTAYSISRIMHALYQDYPGITEHNARKVALAAVARRMMEEETQYEYKVPRIVSYFDLDRYAADEFKRTEEEMVLI